MTLKRRQTKPWSDFRLGRTSGKKGKPKKRFLILCEGEKTEPNYFKSFRVSSAEVYVLGLGANTTSIVEEAIKRKLQAKKEKTLFNEVWCVFDRDSFPAKNFNKAFERAKKTDIKIAYSNEAFEIWYLLHFCYQNTGISRSLYKNKLSKYLKKAYKKNSTTIYEDLLSRQTTAIKNAKRLLETYSAPNPEKDNPSTTVHLLVQLLNANM